MGAPPLQRKRIQLADMPGAPAWIAPLLQFSNQLADGLTPLIGGLTFSDNIACEVVVADFTHGVTQAVSLERLKAAGGVIAIGAKGAAIDTVTLAGSAKARQVLVTVWFKDSTVRGRKVGLLLLSEGVAGDVSPIVTGPVAGILPATLGGTGQSAYLKGDTLYASAANVLARLAAGTDGKVLTLAGGVPVWAPASGVGGSSFTTVYSADLTVFTTQNLLTGGDGAKTLSDGTTWNAAGTSAASTFGITNGSGLRIVRNGAAGDPRLETNLLSVSPNALPFHAATIIWTRMVYGSFGVASTWAHSAIFNSGLGTVNIKYGMLNNAGTVAFRCNSVLSGSTRDTTTANTDDVHVAIIRSAERVEIYTGKWVGGWPAWSDLNPRGNMSLLTGENDSHMMNPGNAGTGSLSFGINADSTAGTPATDLTVTHIRVDQLG